MFLTCHLYGFFVPFLFLPSFPLPLWISEREMGEPIGRSWFGSLVFQSDFRSDKARPLYFRYVETAFLT